MMREREVVYEQGISRLLRASSEGARFCLISALSFLFVCSSSTGAQNAVNAAGFSGQITGTKTAQVVPFQKNLSVSQVRLVFDDQFAYLATPDGLFRTSRSLSATSPRNLIFAGEGFLNLYVRNNILYVLKEGGDPRSNTLEAHSFLKSTDHGQTFVPLDEGLKWCFQQWCGYLNATEAFFSANLIFLAAGGGGNFFVSQDEGKNWKLLQGFAEPAVCSSTAFEMIGNKVLMGGECPLDFAFLRARTLRPDMLDWSGSLRDIMGLAELANRNVQFIAQSPNTSFVFAGVEGGLLKSYDLGESYQFKIKHPFDVSTPKFPYIQQILLPTTYRDLLVVGGFNKAPPDISGYLAYSPDHGENWIDISDLILTPEYSTYSVGFVTQDPQGRILVGLIDDNPTRITIVELLVSSPVLLLTENDQGDRAVGVESVTLRRDPFSLFNEHNFSSDRRTRISLFATNILPGDANVSAITARAEDSAHTIHELPVEFVGITSNTPWLTTIVVRLPDSLANAGDVRVSIAVRGVESNKALLKLQ